MSNPGILPVSIPAIDVQQLLPYRLAGHRTGQTNPPLPRRLKNWPFHSLGNKPNLLANWVSICFNHWIVSRCFKSPHPAPQNWCLADYVCVPILTGSDFRSGMPWDSLGCSYVRSWLEYEPQMSRLCSSFILTWTVAARPKHISTHLTTGGCNTWLSVFGIRFLYTVLVQFL